MGMHTLYMYTYYKHILSTNPVKQRKLHPHSKHLLPEVDTLW